MSVFTIFFCGTGSNSNDSQASEAYYDGELVSSLAKNMSTPEFSNWIIVNGPGSGNLQENKKWVTPWFNYPTFMGLAFGAGWDRNVQHALAVLKNDTRGFSKNLVNAETQREQSERRKQSGRPTTVNLVGWSRGGVTCHMMANTMLKDAELSHIPVNIFAIDPVPGTFNFRSEQTKVGANVRDYYAIYARDELSKGFAPVLPQLGNRGVTRLYTMPGRHATLVGNASEDGSKKNPVTYPQPGKIVRDLVEKQLTLWGTTLNNRLELSEVDILKLYDDILSCNSALYNMRKFNYTYHDKSPERGVGSSNEHGNPFVNRTPLNKIKMLRAISSNPHGNNPIFVNWHHQNLYINNGIMGSPRNGDYPATLERISTLANALS